VNLLFSWERKKRTNKGKESREGIKERAHKREGSLEKGNEEKKREGNLEKGRKGRTNEGEESKEGREEEIGRST
jgi:hypothetical protein